MKRPRVLAVIPARGGSRGLPGKNIRPLLGLPLIAHTIRFAQTCPEITRCVVSTDSPAIARVARRHGADVPFLRPANLARSDTPMWPVLQHALAFAEKSEGEPYDYLMLLDPTSPTRTKDDVRTAMKRLAGARRADGILAVSQPDFNPDWLCVVERDGWMEDYSKRAAKINRRQDARTIYRINGLLYVWRAGFLRSRAAWRGRGRHLLLPVPEFRSVAIDTLEQFKKLELMVKGGLIDLPSAKRPKGPRPGRL